MPAIVYSHQKFLDQVLDVIGQRRESPPQEEPQVRRQLAQKLMIGGGLPCETPEQQVSEMLLLQ
jgi:hypothetical protein